MELNNKNQVREALFRAQMAILNPNKPWKHFASKEFKVNLVAGCSDKDFEVKFSPNVVVMKVRGLMLNKKAVC